MAPTVRRLTAFAVMVATFFIAELAIGAVSADSEADVHGFEPFLLPQPWLGDRAIYLDPAEPRGPGVGLNWVERGAAPGRLPGGIMAGGDTLLEESGGQLTAASIFDGGTPRLLMSSRWAEFEHTRTIVIGGAAGTADTTTTDARVDTYAKPEHQVCVFDGALAGTTIAPGATIALGQCVGPLLLTSGPVLLVFNGTGSVRGWSGAWFSSATPGIDLSILLGPGLPYPLAVRQSGALGCCKAAIQTFELAGFSRGNGPRDGVSDAHDEPGFPDIGTAATGQVFLNDSDTRVPFRLVDAVKSAQPALLAFAIDHPAPILVYARLTNAEVKDEQHQSWALIFADGADWQLEVQVIHREGQQRMGTILQVREDQNPYWPIAALPAKAPRATDLLQAAAWLSGEGADCYGYSFIGPDSYGGRYWAGHCVVETTERIEAGAGTGYQDLWRQDVFWFDQFGGAHVRVSSEQRYTAASTVAQPLGAPPADEAGSSLIMRQGLLPSAPGIVVAASSLAVGVGLLAYFGPTLRSLPLLGLFSRLREDQLADHPMRRRILETVAGHPGVHLKELGRVTGIPNGSLMHHSRRLLDAGLLTVRRGNGYSCYFLSDAQADSHGAAAMLKAEGARKVLSAIAHRPHSSAQDVERQTGLSPATVHHHLRRLTAAGLVRQGRNGRSLSLEATWMAKSALMT